MRNTIGAVSSSSILKEFVKKVLSYKLYFIICIILFVAAAFLVNKYSTPVYEVNASLLLTQNHRSSILSGSDLFKGAEFLQDNKNIENELNMFTSFSLVSSNIANLNFEVGYFLEKEELIKIRQEIYDESPFTVTIDKSHIQPFDVNFYIEILSDSTYRLSASQKEVMLYNYVDDEIKNSINNFSVNGVHRFNQPINNEYFRFSITLNQKKTTTLDPSKARYFFRFYHLDYLTLIYLKRFKVEPVSALASIINIHFKGENISKITTFLNKYVELYLNANLEKKNKAAVSTVQFIDSQISQVSDSLMTSESKLRDYRTSNQITDLPFQGQRLVDELSKIETDRATLEVQKRYYKYVIDYFNKNNNIADVVPPSSMNITDPIMNKLISDLLELNAARATILNSNSQKSLFLGQIESKIKVQKETILENVKNNLNTLNLTINELDYRYNKLSGDISRLPKAEISMGGMERKFKLNDAIYTFLLQKRAEAEISRESSMPDYEVVSPAREITSTIIAPRKSINLLIAIFLGLLIPSLYILIKDFLNDKLESVFEIEQLSKHKVIGAIYKNKHRMEAVVAERPRSSISESFRILRTNLSFKFNGEASRVILITSSVPREGKSFISFNLAASIASMGYKTLVMDCDLRRGTLHDKFNIDNSIGLSTYLVNKSLLDDIIVNTFVPNLFFIPAGPVLPNPAELLESNITEKLFQYLRLHFDYIIIDTSPIGAVADAYLLMKYASQTLIVSRQDYTKKEIFIEVIKGLETNKLSNYDIVFNGLNYMKSSYGRYYGTYYDEKPDKKQKNKKKMSKIVNN